MISIDVSGFPLAKQEHVLHLVGEVMRELREKKSTSTTVEIRLLSSGLALKYQVRLVSSSTFPPSIRPTLLVPRPPFRKRR